MNRFPRAVWSVATFAVGAFGFVRQVLMTGPERPFLLVACLMLMGLPIGQYLDLMRGKRDS